MPAAAIPVVQRNGSHLGRNLLIGAGCLLVAVFVIIVAWWALQDTWEPSHKAELLSLVNDADKALSEGDNDRAASGYQKAIALVGKRKLQDTEMQSALNRATAGIQDIASRRALAERPEKGKAFLNIFTKAQNVKDNPAALLQLLDERSAIVRQALPGSSKELDAWKADDEAIQKAQALSAQTKYADALKLLQDRWKERHTQTPVNGNLAMAIVHTAMGQGSVEDCWGLDRKDVEDLLREVQDKDPLHVEASVLLAFLAADDPKEELLRVDLRSTMQSRRNIPLLKINAALGGDQSGLRREIAAASKCLLGLGRERACREDGFWKGMLMDPVVKLYDAEMNTYFLHGGSLFRKGSKKDGFAWQLLRLDEKGLAWKTWRITFLVSSLPKNDLQAELAWLESQREKTRPEEKPLLESRIAAIKWFLVPLTDMKAVKSFNSIVGNGLAIVDSAFAPEEFISQHAGTMAILPEALISSAWERSQQPGAEPQAGKGLLFTPDEASRLTFAGCSQEFFTGGNWQNPLVLRPPGTPMGTAFLFRSFAASPICILLQPEDDTNIKLDQGKYFRLYHDRAHPFWPDVVELVTAQRKLQIKAYGDGTICFPLAQPAGAAKSETDATSQRMLQAMLQWTKNPGLMPNRRLSAPLPSDRAWDSFGTLQLYVDFFRTSGFESHQQIAAELISGKRTVEQTLDQKKLKLQTSVYANGASFAAQVPVAGRNVMQQARDNILAMRYGIDPHNRLVWAPVKELLFKDEGGEDTTPFYPSADIAALSAGTCKDFFLPSLSLITMPPRAWPGDAGTFPSPNQVNAGFERLISKAREAHAARDYHTAAMLYRDIAPPPFLFQAFDPTKPADSKVVQALQDAAIKYMEQNRTILQIRGEFAQVLKEAGRTAAAGEVTQSALAEWNLTGLPLMGHLRGFIEAYAYSPDPKFLTALSDLQADVAQAAAAKESAAMPERKLPPNSSLIRGMEAWAPIAVAEDNGKLQWATPVIAGRSDIPDKWKKVHSPKWNEVYPSDRPKNVYVLRRLLLEIVADQRALAAACDFKSPQWAVATYNALGALYLAMLTDSAIYGPARFDTARLEDAMDAEIAIYLQPRMKAAGISEADARELLQQLDKLKELATSDSIKADAAVLRFPWHDYVNVASDPGH